MIFFLPDRWLDRAMLLFTVIALSIAVYGIWIVIPGHLQKIDETLKQ